MNDQTMKSKRVQFSHTKKKNEEANKTQRTVLFRDYFDELSYVSVRSTHNTQFFNQIRNRMLNRLEIYEYTTAAHQQLHEHTHSQSRLIRHLWFFAIAAHTLHTKPNERMKRNPAVLTHTHACTFTPSPAATDNNNNNVSKVTRKSV